MHLIYTYQLTIVFFLYKWLYYNNFTCTRGICLIGQVFWCLYNTTKIPFIFISMEMFSHFCDVFIQYYKIVILHFYYHTFDIALGGILYQKLPKKLWGTIFLKHSSKPTPLCVFGYVTFVHVPKEARTKLDSKGVKCIFISYCKEIKGYKLYNLIIQYVIISCNVIFNEFGNFNMGKQWFQGWILDQYKWF
jgi:hypothetical protein